jgi:hypothetical protein
MADPANSNQESSQYERRNAAYPSNHTSISSTSLQKLYSFLPSPKPLESPLQPPTGPGEPKIGQSIPVASAPRHKPRVLPWPYSGSAPWLDFSFSTDRMEKGDEAEEEEAAPMSPKTTTPPQARYYLPDIFKTCQACRVSQIQSENTEAGRANATFIDQEAHLTEDRSCCHERES